MLNAARLKGNYNFVFFLLLAHFWLRSFHSNGFSLYSLHFFFPFLPIFTIFLLSNRARTQLDIFNLNKKTKKKRKKKWLKGTGRPPHIKVSFHSSKKEIKLRRNVKSSIWIFKTIGAQRHTCLRAIDKPIIYLIDRIIYIAIEHKIYWN